jgi:hypothetical protein
MPEAGWLLLLLFLGICSLIVVAVLWPSFRRAQQTVGGSHQIHNEAHAFTSRPPETTPALPISQEEGSSSSVSLRMLPVQGWLTIVNQQPDDAPNTLIVGTSGSGKTTLAQVIVSTRTGKVAILDPKWAPGKWGGLPAVPIDDNGKYTQIEAAIKALLGELSARLVLMKQGQSNFQELTVVVEELPTVVDECPSGAALFKQIGRLGRELRIRLVGLSQSERVKSLGIAGEGDAKDNYLLIRLGKSAIAVSSASRTLSRPAVLEWRGEQYLMLLDGITHLARYPLPEERSWAIQPGTTELNKQSLKLIPKQPQKQSEIADAMFLTLTAEEVGKVAVLIIQGVERSKAIREMPRYNRKQHKEFSAFYDQLKASMAEGQREG